MKLPTGGSLWLRYSHSVKLEMVSDPGVFCAAGHDATQNIAC
jgi:hypothetical protein